MNCHKLPVVNVINSVSYGISTTGPAIETLM